ncbi:hypothetical protein LTR08_000070 [Meristemomyces frigidus]|nr:hypothetical protein LTR08_000070 [Meristemomyces frigidus]
MADDKQSTALPWHLGIFDAHCHPTDTLANLQSIPSMRAKVLTVMATRAEDQELVAKAAEQYGITPADLGSTETDWSADHKILPAFGWHPWFSHQMYDEAEYDNAASLTPEQKIAHYQSVLTPQSDDEPFLLALPDPRPFGGFISQTRAYLALYPLALIGEVGLDRSFRIPTAWLPAQAGDRDGGLTPGGREGRQLSPYRVSMAHQRKILTAQLRLAGDMQRAVSVHGVAAHGVVYETLAATWTGREKAVPSKKDRKQADAAAKANAGPSESDPEQCASQPPGPQPYPPRVCLHSFSGPAETVRQYVAPAVPTEVFFSFSTTINAWADDGNGKVEAAVRAVPDDRVLVESDLHTAGERMDGYLEAGVRRICEVKGWEVEDGVRRLGKNWKRFALGRA